MLYLYFMIKKILFSVLLFIVGIKLLELLSSPFSGQSTFAVTTAYYFTAAALPAILLVYKRLKPRPGWVAYFAVVVSLYIAEVTLRYYLQFPVTYSEKQWGEYHTMYDNPYNKSTTLPEDDQAPVNRHLHIKSPNSELSYTTPEFNYPGELTNQLGLRGKVPVANKTLLLSLGDSFTESVGAPHDSTYPLLLEKLLHRHDTNLQVINGGISGSDPFFEFVLLKHLHRLYPVQTAIFMVNTSDITDVAMRGSATRFLPDGSLQYRNAPFWEPLYAVSYVFRLFMQRLGYNYTLMTAAKEQQVKKTAVYNIAEHFKNDIIPWCRTNHIKPIIVLQPSASETKNVTSDYTMLHQQLGALPVQYLNLLPHIARYQQTERFYWPADGHFNANGYQLVAGLLYSHLFISDNTLLH